MPPKRLERVAEMITAYRRTLEIIRDRRNVTLSSPAPIFDNAKVVCLRLLDIIAGSQNDKT